MIGLFPHRSPGQCFTFYGVGGWTSVKDETHRPGPPDPIFSPPLSSHRRRSGGHLAVSWSAPSFRQVPRSLRVAAGSRGGEADGMRRDRRERPRGGGRELDNGAPRRTAAPQPSRLAG